MKLALGLDVQTNAKGGKFMSIENSHQGALVRKVARPLRGQEGGRVLCELWTEGVEQGVIDNMIVFQKLFPRAARTELESQLQRAVKVSAKGKHVKCKMDLERPAEFARRRGRTCGGPARVADGQWGVLFKVRHHLMLEPLEAPCCPF